MKWSRALAFCRSRLILRQFFVSLAWHRVYVSHSHAPQFGRVPNRLQLLVFLFFTNLKMVLIVYLVVCMFY